MFGILHPVPAVGRILAAIAIVAAIFGTGWTVRGWKADKVIAQMKSDQDRMVADAERRARAEVDKALERTRAATDKAQEIIDAAHQAETDLRAARAAVDAERSGVLSAAARYSASRCAAPRAAAPAGGSASGVMSGDMRPDGGDRLLLVLGEAVGTAGAMAEAADRARNAGLRAERFSEVIRQACEP